MRLTTTARILITSSLATVLLPEGRAAEFIGRLSPDPVPGYGGFGVMLGAPAAEEIPALPEPLSPGARVFQGMLRRPFKDVAVALVVPASQPFFISMPTEIPLSKPSNAYPFGLPTSDRNWKALRSSDWQRIADAMRRCRSSCSY